MCASKKQRTKLARSDRAARRVVARLYAPDERALAALCEKLKLSEGEVIGRALHGLTEELRVQQDLIETLETAVAVAVRESDLGVTTEEAQIVLRGWASAFYALDELRRTHPEATRADLLQAGFDAALERIDSIVAMANAGPLRGV